MEKKKNKNRKKKDNSTNPWGNGLAKPPRTLFPLLSFGPVHLFLPDGVTVSSTLESRAASTTTHVRCPAPPSSAPFYKKRTTAPPKKP